MKKRILSCLLSIAMCLTLLPLGIQAQAAYFGDVTSHWARSYIEDAVDMGLFNGTSPDRFEPEAAMTRAMFVTVLYRMDGGEAETSTRYTDVRPGDWYADAVAWASENGIVTGTSTYRFSPNENVTREQMVTILDRYLSAANAELVPETEAASISFRDSANIAPYAWASVQKMQRAKIVSGKPSGSGYRFDPKGRATRAEVACIMCKFLDQLSYDDVWEPDDVDTSDMMECKDYAQTAFEDAEYDYADDDGLVALKDLSKVLSAYEAQAKELRDEGIITKYNINDDNITVWLAAGGAYIHSVSIKEMQEYAGGSMMVYEPRRDCTDDKDRDNTFRSAQEKYGSMRDIASRIALADGHYPYNSDFGGSNVTVASMKKWDAGSIILWLGHGMYDKTLGPCLVVNESQSDPNKYEDDYRNDRVVFTKTDHCAVTSKFFDQYYKSGSLKGSLIWLGACDSIRDNRLADVLLSKGASTVIGNDNPAFIPRLIYMTNEFFDNLLDGHDAGTALKLAKAQIDIKELGDAFSFAHGGDLKITQLVLRGSDTWKLVIGASITGYVVDKNNKPISGAIVRIVDTDIKATTASDGSYTLFGAATNQSLSIKAEAKGYASQTQTVAVGASRGNANFALQESGRIKLRITADSEESSIDDINCTVYQTVKGKEKLVSSQSSSSRSITLYDLDVGQEYRVKVTVKGYEWAYATTTAEQSPTEIEVKLIKQNINLMPDKSDTTDKPTTKPDKTTSTDLPAADSDGWTRIYNGKQLTKALEADRDILLMADVKDVEGVRQYKGTLDGNGHTITNPQACPYTHVLHTRGWISGLLGGTIKNLKIADVDIRLSEDDYYYVTTANGFSLGLIGYADDSATIENCIILSGQFGVNADGPHVGAFVGCACDITIKNCVNMADVSAISNNGVALAYAGGIIGSARSDSATIQIVHCLNLGSVYAETNGSGSATASGICPSYNAYNDNYYKITITDCGNGGEISAANSKTSTYAVTAALSTCTHGNGYATQKYEWEKYRDILTIVSRDTLLSMWSDVLN